MGRNNLWEDVSNRNTTGYYYVTYEQPIYKGMIYSYYGPTNKTDWIKTINLSNEDSYKIKDNAPNKFYVRPSNDYDGLCVTNAVEIIVKSKPSDGSSIGEEIGRIHIPIHFMLNRYSHAAINEWDGNSVVIDKDDNGVILAPQVGAGKKENDNSFTGVLMGTVKEYNKNEETGLFGYGKGVRSFFLDSQTGNAIFGMPGDGQIQILPSGDDEDGATAILKSSNYNYKPDGTGTGMKISLSAPYIRFGSGDFEVDPNGHITAKGGGEIAGWCIDDYAIFSKDKDDATNKYSRKKARTGMSSVYDIDLKDKDGNPAATIKTVKIPDSSKDNGWREENKAVAFWAGDKDSNCNFFVSHDGYLKATQASIGAGTSDCIFIGKSSENSKYSAIFSGKKDSFSTGQQGFYIGPDGIALGKYNSSSESNSFQVDKNGNLIARKGYIGNGSNGWEIKPTYIKNGDKTSYNDSEEGVFLGASGIGLGEYFYVDRGGNLHARRGQIANWSISDNSIYTSDGSWDNTNGMYFGTSGLRLGDKFSVTSAGVMYAKDGHYEGEITSNSGRIGGWYIGTDTLSGGNITMDSTGSIYAKDNAWWIKGDGTASFTNVKITGGIAGSISLGDGTANISSSGTKIDNTELPTYINSLVVNNLNVEDTLLFRNKNAGWADSVHSIKEITYNPSTHIISITFWVKEVMTADYNSSPTRAGVIQSFTLY